jgi:cephalosporin hydroxylase
VNDPVRDDSHSDYHAAKTRAAQSMRRGVWTDRFRERFVPFSSREMRSDLPREAIRHMSEGKHYISYRGLSMAKDPLDIVLYEMLLYELQPRTIVELGAYTGASALWMKDTLHTFGVDARVLSVDIDLTLVDDTARRRDGVDFIEGDCNRIESVFPPAMLGKLAHPLVLIDDAHVNVDGVYGHFHDHAFAGGDYLIIEDTIPWIPGTFGDSSDNREWGDWKGREMNQFFAKHDSAYRVDRYYTDFFGYNATWNWNGYVKRI